MTCEGCAERRKKIGLWWWRLKRRIQKRVRIISGSQRHLRRHDTLLHSMILQGASMEHMFAEHDTVAAKWMTRQTQQLRELSGMVNAANKRAEELQDRILGLEEQVEELL